MAVRILGWKIDVKVTIDLTSTVWFTSSLMWRWRWRWLERLALELIRWSSEAAMTLLRSSTNGIETGPYWYSSAPEILTERSKWWPQISETAMIDAMQSESSTDAEEYFTWKLRLPISKHCFSVKIFYLEKWNRLFGCCDSVFLGRLRSLCFSVLWLWDRENLKAWVRS